MTALAGQEPHDASLTVRAVAGVLGLDPSSDLIAHAADDRTETTP